MQVAKESNSSSTKSVPTSIVGDALSALSDAAAAAASAAGPALDSPERGVRLNGNGNSNDSARTKSGLQEMAEQGRMGPSAAVKRTSAATAASPSTPSVLAMPDRQQQADPRTAVAPEISDSTDSAREDPSNSTAHAGHAASIQDTHAIHSVDPDRAGRKTGAFSGSTLAASTALTRANNGSPVSDGRSGAAASGNEDSSNTNSSTITGSLKRPFSRVDELLEAAASPSSHSSHSTSTSKFKKSSSSKEPRTISSSSLSSMNNNIDSPSTWNPGASSSYTSAHASLPASTATTDRNDNEAKSAAPVPSAQRKSAYQGPKISMACYSCRSSKTRCSGAAPCSRCARKKMECAYPLRDGRTANRNSLQTLSAVSGMRSLTPPLPSLEKGYEPGAMERFNQAYALHTSAMHRRIKASPPDGSHNTSTGSHNPALLTPLSAINGTHESSAANHQHAAFSQPSTKSKQRTSPYGDSDDQSRKRPSTGSSTTSRTHMSLPISGATNNNSKSSRSPPEEDLPSRLSSSYPHQQQHRQYDYDLANIDSARPATAGGSHYSRSVRVKEEEDGQRTRDRSQSFPYPVPSHLKDYVLPLPSFRDTPLASPVMGAQGRSVGEHHHHEPERFLEGTSTMKESNALQLKEHRRPLNAHPEASAFSEAEPIYSNYQQKSPLNTVQDCQNASLPYPSSASYLSSLQHQRYSPLFAARNATYAQQHHMRGEDAYYAHASIVKREAEASPKIDELSNTPSTATTPLEQNANRTEEDTYNSEIDRSRTSPPSITSTAATSLNSSIYGGGSKADTPSGTTSTIGAVDHSQTGSNIVGPAYVHHNNLLPPILGTRALPDTLQPWKILLEQAGIPDLETLKSEIPFEAVKRYVDCLAESWPNVLPTFTKRFQLRYAIEDALTRACRDAPPKMSDYSD